MGASGWDYFIPYQPDIELALQQLRQSVFEQGEYKGADGEWKSGQEPEFDSIHELLEACAENGTHSILDIGWISDDVTSHDVAPLRPEQLITFFNTSQPTRNQIEECPAELDVYLHDTIGRWSSTGTYIIVYNNNHPSEIFFTGSSGD